MARVKVNYKAGRSGSVFVHIPDADVAKAGSWQVDYGRHREDYGGVIYTLAASRSTRSLRASSLPYQTRFRDGLSLKMAKSPGRQLTTGTHGPACRRSNDALEAKCQHFSNSWKSIRCQGTALVERVAISGSASVGGVHSEPRRAAATRSAHIV